MADKLLSHRDLKVFQAAMAAQKQVFLYSLRFPAHELYDLTNQIRSSSRGVSGAIGEAWRKRRYKAHWISKLTDAEQEAAETQIWLETARDCGYITDSEFENSFDAYEIILGQLTLMAIHPEKWVTPYQSTSIRRPRG